MENFNKLNLRDGDIITEDKLAIIDSNTDKYNANKTEILNTIGTEEMGTTATTIKGAVKELGSHLNENANLLDKSYNLIKYDKKTIDFNLNSKFTLKSVFRKFLDEDGFLINKVYFGCTDYFSSMNSSSGVIKRILNKGTALTIKDLNRFCNTDNVDTEEFFITGQNIPAPHFFTKLTINSLAEPDGLVRNMLVFYKDADNRVQVIFNKKNKQAEIYAVRSGTVSDTYYPCEIPDSEYDIGVYCSGGSFCVFIDRKDGYGWKHLGSRFCAVVSNTEELKKWKIGFGFNISNMHSDTLAETHYTTISNLETRICAGFGYRDHTFIKYEDGSPFIRNGKLYLTVTTGSINMGASGLGIIEYNPSDCTTKLVSLLYNKIGTGVYGDGMAQVFFDRKINAWRVLFSGFGSRSAGIYTYTNQFSGIYKANLLEGVHFVDSTLMNLEENNKMNCYDGDAIYDKSVNKYRLVYVAPFGTLHVAESSDFINWTKISSKDIGEGPKIVSLGGKYYITSSKEDKMYIMDYPNMTKANVINVDINPGHPNPHADIIAIPGNSTKYQFLTMDTRMSYDNSFLYSWGSTYIYECENVMSDGYDFDYIEKI